MKSFLTGLLLAGLLSGCASLPQEKRDALDRMAEKAVAKLEAKNPGLQKEVESSLGCLVIDKKVVKVPVVGTGGGEGVVVDNATGQRTYIQLSRIEVGGGWGVRGYKMLLLFQDPKRLKQAESGTWVWELGAEAAAGKISVEGSSGQVKPKKGYKVYTLTDGGVSATYTLRAIRLRPYRD